MKQRKLFFGVIIFLSPAIDVMSKPHAYNRLYNERKLYEQIQKHKIVVLFVYKEARRDALQYSCNKKYKAIFHQLALSGVYPKKAVLFVPLNIASSLGQQLIEDNGISVKNALPKIVLFKDGVVVTNQHGTVILEGNFTRASLKKFIDSYVAYDIAHFIEQARVVKQYEDIIKDRMHLYYMPYFTKANPWNGYWGWPYYGMAQGNYGGNTGVSFFTSNY